MYSHTHTHTHTHAHTHTHTHTHTHKRIKKTCIAFSLLHTHPTPSSPRRSNRPTSGPPRSVRTADACAQRSHPPPRDASMQLEQKPMPARRPRATTQEPPPTLGVRVMGKGGGGEGRGGGLLGVDKKFSNKTNAQ